MNDESLQEAIMHETGVLEAGSHDSLIARDAIPRNIDGEPSRGGLKPADHTFWTPRLKYSIAVSAGVLAFILLHFFVYVIWRLHGPQYTIGKDGWVHLRDRKFGFEMDLPSQYQEGAIGGGQSYSYIATFNNRQAPKAMVNVQVYQPVRKTTDALTLQQTIGWRGNQGTVTIIEDRSSDRTAPRVDFFLLETHNSRSRRRVLLNKNAEMEIIFYNLEFISDEEMKRVLNSVRWLK